MLVVGLIETSLDKGLTLTVAEVDALPRSGIRAAIEAYRAWALAEGRPSPPKARRDRLRRPQVVPLAHAGRWIARSEDGLRILCVGDSFDDCERIAVEAGHDPRRIAVSYVPKGRFREDEGEA